MYVVGGAQWKDFEAMSCSVPCPQKRLSATMSTNNLTAEDPRLGCPVEYINLKGTSYDKPAVCKYTGNKYYSNAWRKYGIKE